MLGDHDTLVELRRQLETVRRRIDETVASLSAARDSVSADDLGENSAVALALGKGDVFHLCVHLEVALAESREGVQKLRLRLNQLSAADPNGWPWAGDQQESFGASGGRDLQN